MHEHEVSGRPVQGRRAGERRQSPPRRRTSGPRPVRPAVPAVAVRPAEPERPRLRRSGAAGRAALRVPGTRLLARRPLVVAPPVRARERVRRFLAGAAVTALAAAVVVGLGLLADGAAASRAGEYGEQTVTGGSLTPVLPGVGQVLRVTSG